MMMPAWAERSSEQTKALSYIDRADRALDSLEKQLAKELPLNESILERWNKRLEQAKDYLEKAESLGGGDSEVKNRASTVERRFQELSQAVADKTSGLQQAESAASSGDGQAALSEYQRLADLFRDVNGYLRDQRGEARNCFKAIKGGCRPNRSWTPDMRACFRPPAARPST